MLRLLLALAFLAAATAAEAGVRIKDITGVQGVRENQLIGYGLVTGLQGTGDSMRNSPFTEQALQSMLDAMGINVRNANLRTRNVAAVMVTAELPAFIGRGARIDVTVSSLGDATSLLGGTLMLTPLMGPDGRTYAVAQGPVAVSGFASAGQAETLTQGVPTVARVPNGALVEQRIPGRFGDSNALVLELRNPDFKTAILVADAINAFTIRRYGVRSAYEQDLRTVTLVKPGAVNAARFIAEIGDLRVEPDTPARVVIDERSGTVVMGQDVQVSTVAVTHGNLTVRVTEMPTVSQPQPFAAGETVVTPQTSVMAEQGGGQMAIVEGTNLQMLVRGLNQIGLKPTGIIAILQAIKTAGALQADLVIQ
ncbi:flagellar basal body P-ring protein FlgI [Rhizobiales bacterium L72]|uniref:Flagellar P-ring protein n=2 Tax=Propylenella binzhouense TaxID=2555902 RepID=A0A964T3Q7_9HYPH|nr:flagellar basal body P-ring protein FlgI [Propylenella binzhouense]MYZ46977.1 flagellar basal body P-ring protein FlgI [Propylenella binzhouense]